MIHAGVCRRLAGTMSVLPACPCSNVAYGGPRSLP